MHGLISTSEPEEGYLLEATLRHFGLATRRVHDLEQAVDNWSEQPAEFILTTLSGNIERIIQRINRIRSLTIVPLFLITDPISEDWLIRLYDAGTDLVISRPYSSRLLFYQIRSILRRTNTIPLHGLPNLAQGEVQLDTQMRLAIVNNSPPKHLTQLEFRLLYTLMSQPGQILSSEELVERVWGYSGEGNRELVRGLVQRVRAKIEPDPQNPQYILTETGVGYYFTHPGRSSSTSPT